MIVSISTSISKKGKMYDNLANEKLNRMIELIPYMFAEQVGRHEQNRRTEETSKEERWHIKDE